eukprot:RCo051014
MSSIGTGYDLDSGCYSPDGRLFQVEYATKAVDNDGTALGLLCTDGVVIAIEKIINSKMLVAGSNRRSYAVDENIGVGLAGFGPDGRQLANRAREECAEYRRSFGMPIEGRVLADRLALFFQTYTLYWSVRPFGCSVLLASYTDDGPQLYMIDPSGSSWGYYGCALGKGKQIAKTELEKLSLGKLTCREAIKALAKIIYLGHDSTKDKLWELEMGWVSDESGRKYQHVPQELVREAEVEAKAAAEAEEKASKKKSEGPTPMETDK